MSGFALIARRDLRDLARTAAFRILAGILAVLAIVLAAGAALSIAFPSPGAPQTAEGPTTSMLVGMILYFATLLPFLVFLWVFAGAVLAKEKEGGQLETLLAAPVSTKSLWLAKTAAVVLPGLLTAAVSSALIAISPAAAAFLRPESPAFAFPPALLFSCWLGNPLLFAGLGALTVVLGLRSGPDAAIAPTFLLGFGMMIAIPAGIALGIVDLTSWAFASAYLAAGAVEWTVALALARGLTKERIVLSGRES
jgi:ABC-type Na+ efflux pump permease subunit